MLKLTPDIKNALHAGNRTEKYTFDVLNKHGIKKDIEIEVLDASISINSTDAVKRRGNFTIRNNQYIDYLTDRIQPVMQIRLYDGKWKSFPKGRYLMVTPIDKTQNNDQIIQMECMDETVILQQDYFYDKATYMAGTKYTTILAAILASSGFARVTITDNANVLPADLVLDESKSKLAWINELVAQINYREFFMDDYGVANLIPYIAPNAENIGYTYRDDEFSVLITEREIKTDYWNVPNVIKRTVSRPDLDPLTAIYINDNPGSKLSTVSRGMKIVDSQTVDMAASQEELQTYVNRLGFDAQQISQEVTISTLNMPHHEIHDTIALQRDDISGIFSEESWSINLTAGQTMQHKLKRLVF